MKLKCNRERENFTVGKEYNAKPLAFDKMYVVVNDYGDKEVVRMSKSKGVDIIS